MQPLNTEWITVPVRGGTVRFAVGTDATSWHQVGDLRVPSPIELRLREEEAPAVDATIAVIDHVPRLVSLHVWQYAGGREVRKRDLDLDLEGLVAQAVSIVSLREDDAAVSRFPSAVGPDADVDVIRQGIRVVENARTRSQRRLTPDRMKRIAEIYLAQETGGLDAVAEAYNVHRTTAYRWVTKIRETTELIPPREDV